MQKRPNKRRPTMLDVAKLAGVSQTTVSFVINRVAAVGISDETKERVWDAVRQLDYRPNAVAQGLRTKRTNIIGFLTDEVASTPFAVHMIEGAQAAAWSVGKILMIVNTAGDQSIKQAGVEMMLERQVDAIIYASMYHREVHPPPNIYEVPAVLLDCFVGDRSLPSVVAEEIQGGRVATEVLLRRGSHRVGFLSLDHPNEQAATGRREGYRQALAAYGRGLDESLIRFGDSTASSGYRYTRELMEMDEPPTAIFCGTDRMAMGAYDALRDLSYAIPADVAIVGFDNQDVIAAYLRPPLSTMELPHYKMGEWAVRYLIDHADSLDMVPPVQQLITCPFIERASA